MQGSVVFPLPGGAGLQVGIGLGKALLALQGLSFKFLIIMTLS